MPGPGGGSRGGGGGRGGSFGGGGGFGGGGRGSFGGGHHGGFGGPHHGGFGGPHFGGRPPFHHHHHHWGRGPHYHGGGGCLGALFAPIVVIMFAVFLIFYSLLSIVPSAISTGSSSNVAYNENTFQDYANTQYLAEFGSSTAYEDNLLIVFLVEEENCYDYYYIAFLGDHIKDPINYMFGNNQTDLGIAMNSSISASSYKYSLDKNLAQVISQMEKEITALSLDSSFDCNEEHIQIKSHITNKTTIPLTEDTVNAVLESFTEKTGIPAVIVVENMEEVFPASSSSDSVINSVIILVIAVVVIIIAAVAIVRSVRKKKSEDVERDNL